MLCIENFKPGDDVLMSLRNGAIYKTNIMYINELKTCMVITGANSVVGFINDTENADVEDGSEILYLKLIGLNEESHIHSNFAEDTTTVNIFFDDFHMYTIDLLPHKGTESYLHELSVRINETVSVVRKSELETQRYYVEKAFLQRGDIFLSH